MANYMKNIVGMHSCKMFEKFSTSKQCLQTTFKYWKIVKIRSGPINIH